MSANRHAWIADLCTRLEAIMVARDIEQLAPAAGDLLVVVPAWAWLPPRVHMGRKALNGAGGIYDMPVRLTWTTPIAFTLSAGEQVTATWTLAGLGHQSTGTVTFTFDGAELSTTGALPPAAPAPIATIIDAAATVCARLAAAGHTARWEALMSMEGYVTSAVNRAVAHVSKDIHAGPATEAPTILDDLTIDQVRDEVMLGGEQDTDGGAVGRMLERCLAPGAFRNVDPLRYISTDIRRSAEMAVRRRVSDPPIGTKIRRVSRSMPGASLDQIVTAYQAVYPGDRLSVARAARALTIGPDANAGTLSLEADLLEVAS